MNVLTAVIIICKKLSGHLPKTSKDQPPEHISGPNSPDLP